MVDLGVELRPHGSTSSDELHGAVGFGQDLDPRRRHHTVVVPMHPRPGANGVGSVAPVTDRRPPDVDSGRRFDRPTQRLGDQLPTEAHPQNGGVCLMRCSQVGDFIIEPECFMLPGK